MVAVRVVSHGCSIAGWLPEILEENIACSTQILLQNTVLCWTWICASSSATTQSVVRWEHLMNISLMVDKKLRK
jgi:hypothetical protein